MALVLTGIMLGMRSVGNKGDLEYAAGAKWQFLSMEITDPRFGQVYSVNSLTVTLNIANSLMERTCLLTTRAITSR